MALTSLPEVKAFLNVDPADGSQDLWLDALRAAAEAAVKARVNQNLEPATYAEFYSGTGHRVLALRQRPVTAVLEVRLDNFGWYGAPAGSFGPATVLAAGSDYALELDGADPLGGAPWSKAGLLARVGTVWPEQNRFYQPGKLVADVGPSFGNLKVTYQAGYPKTPADLRYAVAYLVAYMRRTAKLGADVHSERLGEYAYQLVPPRWARPDAPELMTAAALLAKYADPIV